ncbi:SAG-related sequence [Besnoitia besnoiti]|uniref:SAG-related sequence n=1 Tax=Besnoitia besnoiti TaxID=94643 RepID=A0A2A9MPJ3_BESBE|nr:SAG-related sequence [Besnoitia besnoiti]PFH37760.1 SAG-related sequence [Besnoitia besnoiti]
MTGRRGGERAPACFTSHVRRLTAVCVGGVLLLSSGQGFASPLQDGLLSRRLQQQGAGEAGSKPDITCNIPAGGDASPNPGSVTLSKTKLTALVKCTGENIHAVPEGMKKVCVARDTNSSLQTCLNGDQMQVPLQQLLPSSDALTWTEEPESDKTAASKQWSLQLKEEQLPFSDKEFFVGCRGQSDSDASQSPCKVTVQVEARPSSVKKNVVSCAYGHTSNPETLKVEMSEETNTLTLVCGTDGKIKPPAYSSSYCSGASLENCSASFTEILPKFEEKWWTAEDNQPSSNSVKLTIPPTDFPSANQRFYVGCSPVPEKDEKPVRGRVSEHSEGQVKKEPTTCKVEVIVRAARSAASATGGTLLACVSGAVALTGLLSGFFP